MDASATRSGTVPIFAQRKWNYPLPSPRFPLSAFRLPPSRRGFTLVELLVVVIIIGILAGLTIGAVQMARLTARRAVIKAEIGQLQMAVERYKNEVGEYPPDFSCLTDPDPVVRAAAQQVLTRHLHRKFPRYTGDWSQVVVDVATNYSLDITQLDPASALVFWLGGLPENPNSIKPAGFHADATNPFQPGLPRTQAYYDFDPAPARLTFAVGGILRYWYRPNLPTGVPPAPYVYFRAQRAPDSAHTYEFMERNPTDPDLYVAAVREWHDASNADVGRAVPYVDPAAPDPISPWRNESTYQILSAGMDGTYGDHPDPSSAGSPKTDVAGPTPGQQFFGMTGTYDYPVTRTAANFTEGDYDNMSNFADGKLEDELQ